MSFPVPRRLRLGLLLLLTSSALAGVRLAADLVETSDGARYVGTITQIKKGVIHMKTASVGDIDIKQSLATRLTVDRPMAVRLVEGLRYDGTLTPAPGGVRIQSAEGQTVAPLPGIAAAWAAGQEDPDVEALRRHWSYEADVDMSGMTGNHSQLGTNLGGKAVLAGPGDTLQLYSAYNRQVTDGQKSSDQFKAGIDYADTFSDRASWYGRDEAGFDRVMGVTHSELFASGAGYAFVKTAADTFTGRAGLSYRYDSYTSGAALDSVGADFEADNAWIVSKGSRLLSHITFVPAFQNLSDFILTQESAYEIPLSASRWKLKVGVSNDYNSRPPEGIKKLDTDYFTRLSLNWGS